ncbi:glycoside hydrolase [Rhexocercosporidium sp. MPI-PUGE-AT-0058]|nr:glycoside hydrolase [Rhexocercosporidium sp. MPI-PUGE-AT-0058]
MRFFSVLVWQLLLLAGPCHVLAKSAFAHFMVGNCQTYTLAEWQNEMALAKAAHLDAFALNMAAGEAGPLALAFQAANNVGFKLFFSFDYGPSKWAASDVLNLIQQYKGNNAYFKYNNQPFVSTFEGTESAQDWVAIKSTTGMSAI